MESIPSRALTPHFSCCPGCGHGCRRLFHLGNAEESLNLKQKQKDTLASAEYRRGELCAAGTFDRSEMSIKTELVRLENMRLENVL